MSHEGDQDVFPDQNAELAQEEHDGGSCGRRELWYGSSIEEVGFGVQDMVTGLAMIRILWLINPWFNQQT